MKTYNQSEISQKIIEIQSERENFSQQKNYDLKQTEEPEIILIKKYNLHLYLFTLLLFFITGILFNPGYTRADDEMDFEEFMGMMSETFTDEQLDEMSYLLPWDIKVLSYGYGDFSGDGKTDIALSITEKNLTPKNSVDIYFLESVGNYKYNLVKKKNIKWIELAIEVAFLIKEGKCFITSRDADNWYFTAYKIKKENLVLVNKETFPIINDKLGN